jgi:hypothetical protein
MVIMLTNYANLLALATLDGATTNKGSFILVTFFVKTFATTLDYILALATFGDRTKNRKGPISVMPLKVARARGHVSLFLVFPS